MRAEEGELASFSLRWCPLWGAGKGCSRGAHGELLGQCFGGLQTLWFSGEEQLWPIPLHLVSPPAGGPPRLLKLCVVPSLEEQPWEQDSSSLLPFFFF